MTYIHNISQSMIIKRVNQRKTKMIEIIKAAVIEYNPEFDKIFDFNISENLLREIRNGIVNVLMSWEGGKKYRYPIVTYKVAHKKVVTHWNREKPKPIGDQLFFNVFACLFKVISYSFVCHPISRFFTKVLFIFLHSILFRILMRKFLSNKKYYYLFIYFNYY